MRVHILNYVKSCMSCTEKRGYKKGQKAELQRMPIPGCPFEMVGMHAVGPLPCTLDGNRHIIVISGFFSRWAEGYAVKYLQTESIVEVLKILLPLTMCHNTFF